MTNPFRRRWAVTENRVNRMTRAVDSTEVIARYFTRSRAMRHMRSYIGIMAPHNGSGIGPRLFYQVTRS